MLKFLYQTVPGRAVLQVLSGRTVSKVTGKFLDSPLSKGIIPFFIKKNSIDLSEYEPCEYESFNAFFCRKIKTGKRPIDPDREHLICPCDGLLSAYPIKRGLVIPVKQSRYSIADLLHSKKLAQEFDEGICLVFRLCVDNYHRYCFVDDGRVLHRKKIPGRLHTVRPIALRELPVFVQNSREYSVISTEHFGTMVQMEVGAMLVGKIQNNHGEEPVRRGQEKGHFLYGGSTVILLLKKDRAEIPEEYYKATRKGREIPVRMGERIGTAKEKV